MDINDFITQTAGTIGISTDDAGKATAGILGLIKNQADESDAKSLISALPGASDLMGSLAGGGNGGGVAGGLMGNVGSLLGGKASSAMTILSIFQGANMNSGQAGQFAGLFVNLLKNNLNGDLVGRILNQVPELKKLVG